MANKHLEAIGTPAKLSASYLRCGRRDSNPQSCEGSRFQIGCVYQFRHARVVKMPTGQQVAPQAIITCWPVFFVSQRVTRSAQSCCALRINFMGFVTARL